MNHHPRQLICIECKKGIMRPALGEGEPDFTDRYICEHCQFEDYIPTPGIIVGQLITFLSGSAICIYLMIGRFEELMAGISNNQMQHAFIDMLLLLIALMFLAGFVFVLIKSYQGLHHRRAYLAGNLHRSTHPVSAPSAASRQQ